jgi:hypothetical protein
MKKAIVIAASGLLFLPSIGQEIESRENKKGKLEYQVVRSSELRQGKRKVTFQKVVPPTQEELRADASAREIQPSRAVPLPYPAKPLPNYTYVVSATVYDDEFSLVTWWPTSGGVDQPYTCVSNIDWSHLNGFHNLKDQGKNFTFMLLQSSSSLEQLRKLQKQGKVINLPEIPKEFPKIGNGVPRYRVVQGDETNGPAMDFMQAIHVMYDSDKHALIQDQDARILAGKERTRQSKHEKENPKEVVIRYYRRDAKTPKTSR